MYAASWLSTRSNKRHFDSTNDEQKQTKRVETRRDTSITPVIWTRISSEKQSGNMSLDTQEKECKQYLQHTLNIRTNAVTLRMVGSGYTVDESIQKQIDIVHTLIQSGKQIVLICYMPDRLLRNFEVAQSMLNEIMSTGGSVHFVKGINGKHLSTEVHEDMPTILDCLRYAQAHSSIQSQRIQDSRQNAVLEKIKQYGNCPEVIRVKNFITLFLKRTLVDDLYTAFRECVDWDAHPEWRKRFYKTPFYLDSQLLHEDNKNVQIWCKETVTEEEITARCKCILSLFNSYKIACPTVFLPRKRWTVYFIKQLGVDEVDQLSRQFNTTGF